jgi:scyllo-inositol 2-dehydrogenase (NAD+)
MIGGLQQTPLLTLTRSGVYHDVFPWYLERFEDAFKAELIAFVEVVQNELSPRPTLIDGRKATEIGLAALESWRNGQAVSVESGSSATK